MAKLRLLIDGYNLLFQSPWVGRGRGPGWLESARTKMLSALMTRLDAQEQAATMIVFDAPKVGSPGVSGIIGGGIHIKYSMEYDEADELLEEMIRKHPTPRLLTVVSSDLRVQRCARTRKALPLPAHQFLNDLLSRLPNANHDAQVEGDTSDDRLSAEEVNFWLGEFGDLLE